MLECTVCVYVRVHIYFFLHIFPIFSSKKWHLKNNILLSLSLLFVSDSMWQLQSCWLFLIAEKETLFIRIPLLFPPPDTLPVFPPPSLFLALPLKGTVSWTKFVYSVTLQSCYTVILHPITSTLRFFCKNNLKKCRHSDFF